jgi:type II secretory pathway pseudopilin PulG
MSRLHRLVRAQSGYSLVELLVVTITLTGILAGLTTAFVEGSSSELDTNRRVQAQIQTTIALAKLRQDVHCASGGSIAGATLTLTGCSTGTVTWVTCGAGTRYALYRNTTTCPTIPALCASAAAAPTTGKLYADCLTSGSVFTYTAQATTSLAKVHVDFKTNVNTKKALDSFEVVDDVILRNSTRS